MVVLNDLILLGFENGECVKVLDWVGEVKVRSRGIIGFEMS